MATDRVEGSCLCGAARFEIDFPTRFFTHCHCQSCRRAFGAPVVSWVGVPSEQFRWTGAEDVVGTFASSEGTRRTFCSRCGTSLTFESVRWAGETHVAAAVLDGPVDREPKGHAFYEEHVPWLTVE